jgi:single-stranded-DNA-specific exonuclease
MARDLVEMLLQKRGVTDAELQKKFLKPDFVRDTHDPFLLHEMERAVARVLAAIAANEKIAVYADFDCDGIPGAALMSDFFAKIGYENIVVYIPHRDREVHGFHVEAVEKLAQQGVALIITIDCGIGAVETAQKAKDLGVDVIITDHHEVTGILPPAVAVVNPKLDPYPFKDLCGAARNFNGGRSRAACR